MGSRLGRCSSPAATGMTKSWQQLLWGSCFYACLLLWTLLTDRCACLCRKDFVLIWSCWKLIRSWTVKTQNCLFAFSRYRRPVPNWRSLKSSFTKWFKLKFSVWWRTPLCWFKTNVSHNFPMALHTSHGLQTNQDQLWLAVVGCDWLWLVVIGCIIGTPPNGRQATLNASDKLDLHSSHVFHRGGFCTVIISSSPAVETSETWCETMKESFSAFLLDRFKQHSAFISKWVQSDGHKVQNQQA